MTDSASSPHTVDDVFRCTQESIAPILEVIRGWFDEGENDPSALIFIQRGNTTSKKQTNLHWGGDAERIFEDLETGLARKIGAFLAADRLMPVDVAAEILRQRVARMLQEHRKQPDWGLPGLEQLGVAHKDLHRKEEAYRNRVEVDWDEEEDPISQDRLEAMDNAVKVLVHQRDLVVAQPNLVRLGLENILDKGIRSAQTLVDAMEQGVRSGMVDELVVQAQADSPQGVDRSHNPTEAQPVPLATVGRRSVQP